LRGHMQGLSHYRRWSVRVPSLMLGQIKSLALSEGWEISDLIRTLIAFGATATWLGLEKQKNLDRLKDIALLASATETLGAAVSRKPRARPYPIVRSSQETNVVSLILPAEYAHMIEAYASTRKISKNEVCGNLLTVGLLAYLKAENSLFHAIEIIRREPQGSPHTST
jgi:hypothetical protein